MSPTRKFAFKLAFYSVFVLYLVGDLYVWHGYLASRFDAHFKPMPKQLGDQTEVVALVYGEPITLSQLNRRMEEVAWQKGILTQGGANGIAGLSQMQQTSLRLAALNDLIDASLLRLKTKLNDLSLKNQTIEAERVVTGIESRFINKDAFMSALVAQKMSSQQLCNQVASRLKQEEKIATVIEKTIPVTDAELKKYYELVKEAMTIPESRQGKHIFFATLDKDAQEVSKKAEAVFAEVKKGTSFAELAAKYSEDERNAHDGGRLGIITRDRDVLPGVDLWSIPANIPVLVQSKLGWHLMQMSPVIPSRIPQFDEVKDQLTTALSSLRRERAASVYAENIRRDARRAGRIEISKTILPQK
ncbi:MAG: peptidylprolyl isomerase [Akkermansia sp.]